MISSKNSSMQLKSNILIESQDLIRIKKPNSRDEFVCFNQYHSSVDVLVSTLFKILIVFQGIIRKNKKANQRSYNADSESPKYKL